MATVTTLLTEVPEEGSNQIGSALHTAHVQVDVGDFTGDDVVQLFNIEANTFIHDLHMYVSEAFSASTTFTVGDGTVADRFLDDTAAAPTATGFKAARQDANEGAAGHLYAAADTIDATIAGSTPTAGTVDFYVVFSRVGSI